MNCFVESFPKKAVRRPKAVPKSTGDTLDVTRILSELEMELEQIDREILALERPDVLDKETGLHPITDDFAVVLRSGGPAASLRRCQRTQPSSPKEAVTQADGALATITPFSDD